MTFMGSDHFPIKIEEIESTNEDHHSRWNFNKANWENFMELCNEKLNPEMFKQQMIYKLLLIH